MRTGAVRSGLERTKKVAARWQQVYRPRDSQSRSEVPERAVRSVFQGHLAQVGDTFPTLPARVASQG